MAKKYQLHGAFPSKAGDSAYQVAQKNGFEGTEKEWLASLVGPPGPGVSETGDYPTLKETGTWRGVTDFTTLTEIRFVENYTPTGPADSWDAGVVAGSITAYREGDVLTVSANGKRKIRLSANAAGTFVGSYKLKKILGLDMLDASEVTSLGGMFVNCYELTDVDMSMWHCGKVTKAGGMFQYCYELRSVKMPHGLNSDTVTVTASMFEECFKLVEVNMANGPTFVGDRMFAKCVNLERVTGLNAVTTIGARAFVYCSKLKDIDLDPAILTSIGESAFRLSSVEDCINLDDLNTACVVADYATRTKRWRNNAVLTAIRTKDIPTVFLSVPHADSQLKYTDVKFAYKDGPWDEDTDPEDVSIARGGCSALSLYHEWQCIHKGTELEKANFLDYWKDFEGDKFADINTDENMPDHFPPQAAMLGWGHEETYITSDEQYDVIIDRLNKHLPTCVIMHSTNIDGYHAVVIIGADTLTRKLAVLDSAVTAEGAVLTWVKFEDIFTDAADGDRLVVHTFGEGFEGYEPPEYVPVPETASVGQTIVVKAVDDAGKPTEWEAVDMAIGGSSEIRHIKTLTLEDDVQWAYVDTDEDGNAFHITEVVINIYSVGAESNTGEAYFKVVANNSKYTRGNQIADINAGIRKAGSSRSMTIMIVSNGVTAFAVHSAADNENLFDADMLFDGKLANTAQYSCGIYGCKSIESLMFGSDVAKTVLGAGTKIAIWGR